MAVLIDLNYDHTCQDLDPEFEDRHETFFEEGTGYFMQLMAWDLPQLQTDVRPCCLALAVTFTP
jgi:exportin-2 (importin alpha re-exporter)